MIQALLFLLPALAVFVPLLARRYPGERVVHRLRTAPTDRAEHRPRRTSARPRRAPERSVTRGSLLMGRSLAVRPPPFAASAG